LGTLYNNPLSFLTAMLGCMGPGTALALDSPCGAQALDLAVRACAEGRADLAVAVGCGSWLSELTLRELADVGLLSAAHNGAASYRPFDSRRDGFLAGEGGAAIVVERIDVAQARGARVLGTVVGGGGCTEATEGLRVPDAVTERSMRLALDDAGRTAEELAFVCPHGSGTRAGDRSEAASLHRLLGHLQPPVPVCALKPYTGHMGAASDLAEIAVGLEAVRRQTVPATPGLRSLPQAWQHLGLAGRRQQIGGERTLFLSAAYGLGGQSWSVVVRGAERE
jgi:3-oxoacyl-[acyl-carrier-protein] synthase II